MCDQSLERHALVSFPGVPAKGVPVSSHGPVYGVNVGPFRGCNKELQEPNCSKVNLGQMCCGEVCLMWYNPK